MSLVIKYGLAITNPEQEEKKLGKTQKFDHMKLIGQYAGGCRHLITLGRLLAGISAVMVLIPYYDLWRIISIALKGEDLSEISRFAWQAVILTVASLLIYVAALLCTHIAAFRVQANMRSWRL